MRTLCLFAIVSFCFMGCSTLDFGGSVESSATYVSKSGDVTASSKSTSSTNTQSEIDMKVQEIRAENDANLVKKYIDKGL